MIAYMSVINIQINPKPCCINYYATIVYANIFYPALKMPVSLIHATMAQRVLTQVF